MTSKKYAARSRRLILSGPDIKSGRFFFKRDDKAKIALQASRIKPAASAIAPTSSIARLPRPF
jgi:hypothetical protein